MRKYFRYHPEPPAFGGRGIWAWLSDVGASVLAHTWKGTASAVPPREQPQPRRRRGATRQDAPDCLRGNQSHAFLNPGSSHYRRTLILTALCLLLLFGAMLGQNLLYWPDPTWRAPEAIAAKPNPLAQKPWAAAGGKKLFLKNCAECHDKDGNGLLKKHSADLQLPVVQQQSDGALFWKITNGNTGRGMPSFSKLPERERWQIVLFIRTLKPAT